MFNIMDNITLLFCTIHVTIHVSLKTDASAANGFTDLYNYWRFYSSLNALSLIFLILCTKHDNGVDCYDCEIQTYAKALCYKRRVIS